MDGLICLTSILAKLSYLIILVVNTRSLFCEVRKVRLLWLFDCLDLPIVSVVTLVKSCVLVFGFLEYRLLTGALSLG